MPKYWGKHIFSHVITMAGYAFQRHLGWRPQAAWAKILSFGRLSFMLDKNLQKSLSEMCHTLHFVLSTFPKAVSNFSVCYSYYHSLQSLQLLLFMTIYLLLFMMTAGKSVGPARKVSGTKTEM